MKSNTLVRKIVFASALGLFHLFGMNDMPLSSEIYNLQIEHAQTSKVEYVQKTRQQEIKEDLRHYLLNHTEEEFTNMFNKYQIELNSLKSTN
jgi:hypothetical protein